MKIKSFWRNGLWAVMTVYALSGAETARAEWNSASPITVISREDGSGTRAAFTELFEVLGEFNGKKADMTTLDSQITNSTSVMLTTVAGDEYAIGYISLGSFHTAHNDKVKTVKINGTLPNIENIQNGSYTISRPFNIAVKTDLQNSAAADFISFVLSPEGQAVVQKAGYIPVTEQKLFHSTNPAGKAVVGGSSSVAPVMEKLIEAYEILNPKAELELQITDSTTGMLSVMNGSYDIGMASRALKEKELSQGLQPLVIATDGIAVIINKNNPNDNFSNKQIRAIYLGDAKKWEEVSQ